MRLILVFTIFVIFISPGLGGIRSDAGEIEHRLFDANLCMVKNKTFQSVDCLDFYWGCGDQ